MNTPKHINPSYAQIKLVPGDTAPRYPGGVELGLDHVSITEKGTNKDLPIVDFVMKDADGNIFVLVLTGRILNMISAAIKGVNLRNHGKEEP